MLDNHIHRCRFFGDRTGQGQRRARLAGAEVMRRQLVTATTELVKYLPGGNTKEAVHGQSEVARCAGQPRGLPFVQRPSPPRRGSGLSQIGALPGWSTYMRGELTHWSRASPQTLRDMRRDSPSVPNLALRSKSDSEGQHVRRQRQQDASVRQTHHRAAKIRTASPKRRRLQKGLGWMSTRRQRRSGAPITGK